MQFSSRRRRKENIKDFCVVVHAARGLACAMMCVCVFCALLACVSFLYKCGHLNVTPENNFL